MDNMIVYEDTVLLVVHKPAGIATETAKIGQADLVSELKNYRKKKGEDTYIGIVHRLDQPVEGLLVFAKDTHTAKTLSDCLREGNLTKKYVALIAGVPQTQEGVLTDFLIKDGRTNLSKVVLADTPGAKKASLQWKLLAHNDKVSLLEIELFTGRHHQIRVQMAYAGFPLLGDLKYGSVQGKELSDAFSIRETALLAYQLCFIHPIKQKKMEFLLNIDKFMKIFCYCSDRN